MCCACMGPSDSGMIISLNEDVKTAWNTKLNEFFFINREV